MVKKKYISLTGIQYTFPVVIQVKDRDKTVWVSFKGNENDYTTSNESIQDAIEATDKFKNKEIGLSESEKITEDKTEGVEKKVAKKEETTKTAKVEKKAEEVKEDKTEGAEKVHAGITSPLDARDILLGEPYNVHPSAVQKNPEVILKKATELGVSFPDVKWDAQ